MHKFEYSRRFYTCGEEGNYLNGGGGGVEEITSKVRAGF